MVCQGCLTRDESVAFAPIPTLTTFFTIAQYGRQVVTEPPVTLWDQALGAA